MRPTFPIDDLTDQSHVLAADGKQLVYHSEPFDSDLEISGFFRLRAWISIDQPDTDFRACVYEIESSGRSVLLTADSIRARYRESLREPRLVGTTDARQYDFEGFTFVARRIAKGSRLRLVVGPVNSIYSQRNYNSGGVVADETMADARAVTVRLFHDHARPSALYVPIGQGRGGEHV
jgi:predicted acyl esterase